MVDRSSRPPHTPAKTAEPVVRRIVALRWRLGIPVSTVHAVLVRCRIDTAVTATGVLTRAVTWFADHGGTVERVLSDNRSRYRSHTWRNTRTDQRLG
ncbi:hypothetical protein JCM33774_22440 [Actinophytocola sp. KF-1]